MLDKYVVRAEPLAARTFDGETVVLTLADRHAHFFNGTATVVFEAIDGRQRVRDLIARVCEIFDVDSERATEGVLALLADLEEKGIVRLVDEPQPGPTGTSGGAER